jgi:hypothetical protein
VITQQDQENIETNKQIAEKHLKERPTTQTGSD